MTTASVLNVPARNTKVKRQTGDNPNAKKYVTNAQLLEEFHLCKKAGKLSNKMAGYLYQVAEKYSYHHWFRGYSFREDMVGAAVVNLCANWHKFDPNKSENPNPFSYYTTSVYRSFLAFLDDERKERDIRDELLIQAGAAPSWNYASAMAGSDAAFSTAEE